MALHKDFPSDSRYVILDPAIRWFPADEALREKHGKADAAAGAGIAQAGQEPGAIAAMPGATETSRSLLNWWFKTPHLLPQADGTMAEFQYYFAQREALETIIYLYDVVGVKDKYDLMRFAGGAPVTSSMFDERLATLCGEDGDRRGQDQGDEPGAGVELFPQAV
jgi:type III restriction enzyme